MLTNIIQNLAVVQATRDRNTIPAPFFADLHLSDICNQNCLGCAYAKIHSGKMMNVDDAFVTVSKLICLGVRAFDIAGGGEPNLLPYLPQLMFYIKTQSCHVGLITNGLEISEELEDAIRACCTYVRFSFETWEEDLYCKYKQCGSREYRQVTQNFKRLSENRNYQLSAKFSVGKSLRGQRHLSSIAEFVNLYSPDLVTLKALRHEPEELDLSGKIIEGDLAQLYFEHDSRISIKIIPDNIVPQCYLNPFHVFVNYAGDMFLCCYYYYRQKEHYIGNILTEDLTKLWYSKEHTKKIKAIDRSKCGMVDCKFFAHHKAVEDALERGRVFFL